MVQLELSHDLVVHLGPSGVLKTAVIDVMATFFPLADVKHHPDQLVTPLDLPPDLLRRQLFPGLPSHE